MFFISYLWFVSTHVSFAMEYTMLQPSSTSPPHHHTRGRRRGTQVEGEGDNAARAAGEEGLEQAAADSEGGDARQRAAQEGRGGLFRLSQV